MKFKVGDILRSKGDMTITVPNGKNIEEGEEDVEQGEYFAIIHYGEYEDEYDDCTCIGWILLSQKNASRSRWNESYCDLSYSFIKVE